MQIWPSLRGWLVSPRALVATFSAWPWSWPRVHDDMLDLWPWSLTFTFWVAFPAVALTLRRCSSLNFAWSAWIKCACVWIGKIEWNSWTISPSPSWLLLLSWCWCCLCKKSPRSSCQSGPRTMESGDRDKPFLTGHQNSWSPEGSVGTIEFSSLAMRFVLLSWGP